MPFTLCHPALVLPLQQRAPHLTSLSALVIGSMMPDLPYFFVTGASGDFSHTLLGILVYCVPVGLLVYLLYHGVLRAALVDWAPPALAARMQPEVAWKPRNARATAIVLGSLALGAASHLVWDAFTHADTLVSDQVAGLRAPVALGVAVLPLDRVLQHLNTLAGFLVIVAYGVRWFVRTEAAAGRTHASARQRLAVLATLVASSVVGGTGGMLLRPARSAEQVLFNIVVSAMAVAAVALVGLCLWWRNRRRQKA